ncbi:MAG: DUF427 domain-containing protein [Bacteroidota bacterium]
MKAIYNGQVVAESDKTVVIEGNHYFPPDSVKQEFFMESPLHTTCPWKGKASYYHLKVAGEVLQDGAWYYPTTSEMAKSIEGYIAFYAMKGVEVVS